MKKTFLEDLKKTNLELGEYISKLVENKNATRPYSTNETNEALYGFFFGRMLSLNEVNLMYQTASEKVKPTILSYINWYKENIKIDTVKNLKESIYLETETKFLNLAKENNLYLSKNIIQNLVDSYLKVREKSLPYLLNQSYASLEICDAVNVNEKIYKDFLDLNHKEASLDTTNFSKYINFFNQLVTILAKDYLYLSDKEIDELIQNSLNVYQNVDYEFIYNIDLKDIYKYFSLSEEEVRSYFESLFSNKKEDANAYFKTFLNLVLYKMKESTNTSLSYDLDKKLDLLNKIYSSISSFHNMRGFKDFAGEGKESFVLLYEYESELLNAYKYFSVDKDVIKNLIASFFENHFDKKLSVDENFEPFLKELWASIVLKDMKLDINTSEKIKYISTLYIVSSKYNRLDTPHEYGNLKSYQLRNIILSAYNIKYVSDSLKEETFKFSFEGKNTGKLFKGDKLHNEFITREEIFDKKIDDISYSRESNNQVIEVNLKTFKDAYDTFNLIHDMRSKFKTIFHISSSKKEKRFINNFINILSTSLCVSNEFISDLLISDNPVKDQVKIICSSQTYLKTKTIVDAIEELKLDDFKVSGYDINDGKAYNDYADIFNTTKESLKEDSSVKIEPEESELNSSNDSLEDSLIVKDEIIETSDDRKDNLEEDKQDKIREENDDFKETEEHIKEIEEKVCESVNKDINEDDLGIHYLSKEDEDDFKEKIKAIMNE